MTVIELESVNLTAARLNTNQSNVSYTLEKLRQAFNDPLFIRYGKGVKPTPRANAIANEIRPALERIDSISLPDQFNPVELDNTFVIGATSYEIHTLMPKVKDLLFSKAPNVKLQIKLIGEFNFEHLVHDCHLLVSPHLSDIANVRYRQLFEDDYLTYFDSSRRGAPNSLNEFVQSQHAVVVFGNEPLTVVDHHLKIMKKRRSIKLKVGNFDFLPVMMKNTNLITTLPSLFANNLMAEFASVACPIELKPLRLYSIWHERYQNDKPHRWLRNIVFDAASETKD